MYICSQELDCPNNTCNPDSQLKGEATTHTLSGEAVFECGDIYELYRTILVTV